MKNKKESFCLLCFISLLLLTIVAKAQQKDETIILNLEMIEDLRDAVGGALTFLSIEKTFPDESEMANYLDSILYEYYPQKNTGCNNQSYRARIMVKQESDSLKICLQKHLNPFLKKEITLSYHRDSLYKSFNDKSLPRNHFPHLELNYPICSGQNDTVWAKAEYRLIPYQTGANYNDPRIQKLRLTLFDTKQRKASFNGFDLFINIRNGDKKDPYIFVRDKDGKIYGDRIVNNIKYQFNYHLYDTIYMAPYHYRVESIDDKLSHIELRLLPDFIKTKEKLEDFVLMHIQPLINEDKKMTIIDLWGTWCNPCIAALPKLKSLYEEVSDIYNIVGICSDKIENKANALQILKERNITWPQYFDEQGRTSSIVNTLNVLFFPTYIIINNKGEIIYKGSKFDELKQVVLDTYNNKTID